MLLPGEYFHCETVNQKKKTYYPWCLEGSLSDAWSQIISTFHGRECWKVSYMSSHAFNDWQKIMIFLPSTLFTISLISQLRVCSFGVIWIRIKISDHNHSAHGTSKELMNTLWSWIHQLLQFNAKWSVWSWINDSDPDYPKGTHP